MTGQAPTLARTRLPERREEVRLLGNQTERPQFA
jgi:hypothetical protein